MAESSPLELAKTALSLLQEGSDSEDEILALSLVTSAVALHLLKQPQRGRNRRFNNSHFETGRSRSPSPEKLSSTIEKSRHPLEACHEVEVNTTVNDKLLECMSSEPPINDFKIEVAPSAISTQEVNENSQSEDSNISTSDKKRKRTWSRFEEDRRRVLLRLNSNDSLDLFCAEPKITDYMSIFLDSLKMDISTFNQLLSLVRKDIEHQNTCMRMTVASEQRLAILLKYLSTGGTYNSIEKAVKVSKSFLCVNMPPLCKALWTNLKDQYLKLPSCEGEWAAKAEEFDSRWQFPLCLGALTRRYFKFKNPRSATVLALVDANHQFMHVEIEKDEEGVYLAQENAPPPQSIGNGRVLPYVFIAENGLELDEHIMTPFVCEDTSARKTFNARLKKSSLVCDETFRILAKRFKILSAPMSILQHHIDDVIRACCILHNFLMVNNPDLYAVDLGDDDVGPEVITLNDAGNFNENAEAIREEFAEYFANEGIIPTFNVKLFEEDGTPTSNVLVDMLSF